MYACSLTKYQVNFIITLCDSVLRDPSVRFSKNKYKVELRQTVSDIKESMQDTLKYGNMDDDEEGE